MKWNTKSTFLHFYSLPHTKPPKNCHKTKALKNYEKEVKINKEKKITLEDEKKQSI